MGSGRVVAEDLTIEHVRKPRKGVPIRSMKRGNRPNKSFPRQTMKDFWVVGYVLGIIKVEELRLPNGPIGRDRGKRQEE